jgi:hypothetical protein
VAVPRAVEDLGKAAAVIAVGLAVIVAVTLLTGGVVADSTGPDSLTFFNISVHATSAQVFLTGALCTWMLFAAVWLLTSGMRRSRLRTAELAEARRMRRERQRDEFGTTDRFAEPEGWADDEVHADRLAVDRIPVRGIPIGSASIGPGSTRATGAIGSTVSANSRFIGSIGSVDTSSVDIGLLGVAGKHLLGRSGFGDGDDPAAGQQPTEEPPGGQ